jgi:hypothetical protein
VGLSVPQKAQKRCFLCTKTPFLCFPWHRTAQTRKQRAHLRKCLDVGHIHSTCLVPVLGTATSSHASPAPKAQLQAQHWAFWCALLGPELALAPIFSSELAPLSPLKYPQLGVDLAPRSTSCPCFVDTFRSLLFTPFTPCPVRNRADERAKARSSGLI